LSSVTTGASVQGSYLYGPGGERILVNDPTGVHLYLSGVIERHLGPGGIAETRNYTIGSTLVATRTTAASGTTSSVNWLLGDVRGSVSVAVTATGTITAQTYHPYGSIRAGDTTSATTRAYIGQHKDHTNLSYLNHRYMNPTTGQFLSVDPLVDTTHQPYLYANGNPTTLSDPSGLCAGLTCNAEDNKALKASSAVQTPPISPTSASSPVNCSVRPGCVSQAPPSQPRWEGPIPLGLVDAGSSLTIQLNPDLCDFLRCDVIVKTTFIGGDVMGGGSVSLSLFGGADKGFADVASFPISSTAMGFPRRSVDSDSDVYDLWAELPRLSDDPLTDQELVVGGGWFADPPPATLTVTAYMVGLGATTKYPGSGGSYFVELFINPGRQAWSSGFAEVVDVDWTPG
jgi:RHS repeat-associated protein